MSGKDFQAVRACASECGAGEILAVKRNGEQNLEETGKIERVEERAFSEMDKAFFKIFKLFRQTHRQLLYRELDEVFGEVIEISSPSLAAAEVKERMHEKLPWLKGLVQNDNSRAQLMKYSMLDITMRLTDCPALPQATRNQFRSLGFLPSIYDRLEEAKDMGGAMSPFLEEVLDDTARGIMYARFYLIGSDKDYTNIDTKNSFNQIKFRESFPRRMAVVDACLANAESVWVLKHLYL